MDQRKEVSDLVAGCVSRSDGTWYALATQARCAMAQAAIAGAHHVAEPRAAASLRQEALLAAHAGGWQHPGRPVPHLVMGDATLRAAWLAGQVERLEVEAIASAAAPHVRRLPPAAGTALPPRMLPRRLPRLPPPADDPPTGGFPPPSPYWPPSRF